jgi:hypothetical protein
MLLLGNMDFRMPSANSPLSLWERGKGRKVASG